MRTLLITGLILSVLLSSFACVPAKRSDGINMDKVNQGLQNRDNQSSDTAATDDTPATDDNAGMDGEPADDTGSADDSEDSTESDAAGDG